MFERFSDASRRVLVIAQDEVRSLGHGHIGTEHLLLGIVGLGRGSAAEVLAQRGATPDAVRHKVREAVGPGSGAPAGELPFTARAKRALERANRYSLHAGAAAVEPAHVLRGVLAVEGTASQVLRSLGVDVDDLVDAVDVDDVPDEPTTPPEIRATVAGPVCGSCGRDVEEVLAFRAVEGRDDVGERRPFVVVYCSACGTTLGVTPA